MEWPATATTAASGGNRESLLGQRPARRKRSAADAGSRNPVTVSEEKAPSPPAFRYYRLFAKLCAVQKKATLTKKALIHVRDLDYIGKRTFLGNYSLTEDELSALKKQAAHGYMMEVENRRLKEELSAAKKEAARWSNKYHDLWYDVKPYLDALHRAPELVRGFLEKILAPKQERTMNVPQRNRKRGQDVEL